MPSNPHLRDHFQEIAVHFCSHAGQQYIVTVDCFSDWPEITPMMTNTMTTSPTSSLKSSFCHTSVSNKVWTYQGPQFTYKAFQVFAKY